MVIWKDDMPYIVRDIEDLKDVVPEEIFEPLKEFIEEHIGDSEELERLNSEIESLEWDLSGCEDECDDLERALEELKEKYRDLKHIVETVKDFIDVMDDSRLTKDQAYYWDKLKDAVDSL